MKMAFSETRSLLRSDVPTSRRKVIDIPSSSSDEWSSSYSGSSGSPHSSNDSYTVEWESHVSAHDGSLFYLEYNIQPVQTVTNVSSNLDGKNQSLVPWRSEFKRTSTRRSKKPTSRLGNFINSKHKAPKEPKKKLPAPTRKTSGTGEKDSTTKVKFNELAEGEVKEITVFLDPSMRLKYGRRTSVSEALLGVSVCPFSDSTRVMIAGYMPNSEINQDKSIKIGDCLKAINDQEVNTENFELILLSFTQPTYIKLQLQRIAVEEPPYHPNIAKVSNTSEYVDMLRTFFPVNKHDERDHTPIFSLLLLSLDDSSDNSSDGSDIIYSYPPKESNYLYSIRGTFITMNSLFRECTFNAKPKITTVTIQSVEYYVSYYSSNEELLLIAIPAKRISMHNAKHKINTIVQCLEFTSKTLSNAFSICNSFNANLAPNSQSSDEPKNFAIDDVCCVIKMMFSIPHAWNLRFEDSMQEPHYIVLPKEGQLRMDDALNELEAMDYREWNDEPLKSIREFYILGSALYFRKYLLASHLPKSDLLDIEAFLRTSGIYLLLENKPVRELVIWHEIYPKSVCPSNPDNQTRPRRSSRWFLTIIARNQLFMAVILESRHKIDVEEPTSSAKSSDNITPSRFYIEEIQDTLDHLQSGGIENLANTWLYANKRPETILLKEELMKAAGACGGHPGMNVGGGTTSSTSTLEAAPGIIKNTEIISILKRRNNSVENVNEHLKYMPANLATGGNSPSLHSQAYSETSMQKYEDDDDDDDDESDSDWDGFPDSQRSSSGFDMSDMTSTFMREISDVLVSKVTAGRENVLYHYVQVEMGEGTLMAPPSIHSVNVVSFAFQKASLLIHTVLQNTLRFRHLLSQEASTQSMNRSLVAIKEHGVLVSDEINSGYEPFWVIGRLFTTPLKEVYVCHRADIPQNVTEIAYRLNLHSAG